MRWNTVALLSMLAACPAARGGFPWPLGERPRRVDATAAEVSTVGGTRYDRRSSRVLVRRVSRATLANLDHAAYHANVVIQQLETGEPVQPGQAAVPEAGKLFGGVLRPESLVASLGETPLSAEERRRPMAFSPLVDYLARWNAGRAAGLEQARAGVRGERWGLVRRPGTHLQEISTLYLHRPKGGATQAWVKIEFEPWARLFEGMPDEDGDGYPEIYGQLRPDLLPAAAIERVEGDYAGRVLTTAEVHAWANQLASYWYPSFNTDVVKLQGARRWPLATTEPDVAREGPAVDKPTVVIRGKPKRAAIYNVLVISGVEPLDGKRATAGGPARSGLKAAPVTVELDVVRKALEAERERHGGWEAWTKRLAPVHRAIRAWLARRPEALKALIGRDGFLFYRRSLDYVVGGEIQAQPKQKNPLAAIVEFKRYLEKLGVDFLLVPVPTKSEVFPDKLAGVKLPAGQLQPINPHGRKFLLELIDSGVEVADLLPVYLEARSRRARGQEPIYQPQDTHWTDRGLQLAADAIAGRIRRYPWWPELAKRQVKYTLKRTTFTREGDLQSRLTPAERRRFRPARLVAHQVLTPEGKLFEDDASSPIVVLGDSFTGVYQRIDCGSAGISAHIAHRISHPVDLVMSYGGGPNVRNELLTRDRKVLAQMRLVIWLFAARDFFNYWDDWAPLAPEKP